MSGRGERARSAIPVVDFGDKEQTKRRNEEIEELELSRERRESSAISAVMELWEGRLVIAMLLDGLTQRGDIFTGNALTTAGNAVLRDAKDAIEGNIRSNTPEHYFTMLREFKEHSNG